MAAIDAEMVEQRDVVGGIAVPAVLGRDRGAGAAAGVALIHRNDAKIRGKFEDRVDRRGGLAPDVDRRLQAGGREGQNGEPAAELDRKSTRLNSSHVAISY